MTAKLTRRQFNGGTVAATIAAAVPIAISAKMAAAAAAEAVPAFVLRPEANLYRIIVKLVTEQYGVTVEDIFSDDRSRRVVHPRQMGMYLGYMFTNNMCEAGRRVGGRDGVVVLHACRKLEKLRQTDAAAAAEINRAIVLCVRAMREKKIPINAERYAKARWHLKMGRPHYMPSWRIQKYGQAFVDYEANYGWLTSKMKLPG